MKIVKQGMEEIKCYQDNDLKEKHFIEICKEAKWLWELRTREYIEKNGDVGACVMGAGFNIWYLPPRARKPRKKMILRSPLISQGSVTWEYSKYEIEQFFKKNEIDVYYTYGTID